MIVIEKARFFTKPVWPSFLDEQCSHRIWEASRDTSALGMLLVNLTAQEYQLWQPALPISIRADWYQECDKKNAWQKLW